MNCPLCRENSERIFEIHNFSIRDCAACGHRFTELSADEAHVSDIYDDSYFTGGGAGYSDYAQEGEMLRARGKMYESTVSERGFIPGFI